jgi:plastocyanin
MLSTWRRSCTEDGVVKSDRRAFVVAALAALPATVWSSAARGAAAARVHVVRLNKMKFGPIPQGVKVGDTIEWVNDDIFRHTATARNSAFDVDLNPGAKARVVLKSAGKIDFYCRYHPGMTGRLIVAAKGS